MYALFFRIIIVVYILCRCIGSRWTDTNAFVLCIFCPHKWLPFTFFSSNRHQTRLLPRQSLFISVHSSNSSPSSLTVDSTSSPDLSTPSTISKVGTNSNSLDLYSPFAHSLPSNSSFLSLLPFFLNAYQSRKNVEVYY